MDDDDLTKIFGEVIHAYSRTQAIEDGVLVVANAELAHNAGFVYPVAYTRAVFEDCIDWTDADAERTGALDDAPGREWDVLQQLRRAIRAAGDADRVHFAVARISRSERHSGQEPETVQLFAHCGPGDNAEPVFTVMKSEDDL
jgi:hypothetical protein